jgi:glucose/arabinose dehydrogenase
MPNEFGNIGAWRRLDRVFYLSGRRREYIYIVRPRREGEFALVPMNEGRATGEYVDFMTGFVTPGGEVWGRPVAVAVARDGSLLVTDDGGNCVWRVSARER